MRRTRELLGVAALAAVLPLTACSPGAVGVSGIGKDGSGRVVVRIKPCDGATFNTVRAYAGGEKIAEWVSAN